MCHILYLSKVSQGKDCGQQIRMDQVNGKWAAVQLNGSGFHTCKQQQRKKEQIKAITLDQVDIRLKRVENMLFNIGAKQ